MYMYTYVYMHMYMYVYLGSDPVVQHPDDAGAFGVGDDVKDCLCFFWSSNWHLCDNADGSSH